MAEVQGEVAADKCVTKHVAMIYDRGGSRKLSQLINLAKVEWNRERDNVTLATITISAKNCVAQISTIRAIAAKRHELVLFEGDDRVWEGPIDDVNWYSNRIEIIAKDVAEYPFNAPLTKDWPNEDEGGPRYMTDRVEEIIEYEMTTNYQADVGIGGVPNVITIPRWETIDPPANVLPFLDVRASTGPQGILTRSSTAAFEMTLGEHLSNLAQGGLNYTALGRRLIVWDGATPLGRTRIVTDSDFYGELRVIQSGADAAMIGHISATRDPNSEETAGDGGVGNAGGPDPFYGVWTRLTTLASEEGAATPTQMELNTQARRIIAGRNPVPMEIRTPEGGGLRLSRDLGIQDLVPGVIMPVRATLNLLPVQQDQVIDKVNVKEDATGLFVSVVLSPVGHLEATDG